MEIMDTAYLITIVYIQL